MRKLEIYLYFVIQRNEPFLCLFKQPNLKTSLY